MNKKTIILIFAILILSYILFNISFSKTSLVLTRNQNTYKLLEIQEEQLEDFKLININSYDSLKKYKWMSIRTYEDDKLVFVDLLQQKRVEYNADEIAESISKSLGYNYVVLTYNVTPEKLSLIEVMHILLITAGGIVWGIQVFGYINNREKDM